MLRETQLTYLRSCECVLPSFTEGAVQISDSPTPPAEYWIGNSLYCLNEVARKRIEESVGWLDDNVITAAQSLIHQHFPFMFGLEPTLKQETLSFEVHTKDEFVQIFHVGSNHWCTVTNIGCDHGVVNVYDSMFESLCDEAVCVIASLVFCATPTLTIRMMDVAPQTNMADCGVFVHCLCIRYLLWQ